jgi:galactose mutarotase-like enzyme
MRYYLENDDLLVAVDKKGAELVSLLDKKDSYEFLWQGNEKYWIGHSPVLFPIVGALRGGCYHFEGKTYPLQNHGFAREKEFSLSQNDATSLRVLLSMTTTL